MKEFDYLLNLSAVKWEDEDFDKDTNIHEQGFRSLDSNYLCDVLFLDRIKQKANELGYVYEYMLNTLDVEEYDINHPPYEKLWVYSKTDEPYPESVIGVYRAQWYRAEDVDAYHNIGVIYDDKSPTRRNVDKFQYDTRKLYDEFTDMFCGKDGYYKDSNDNKVRSIVIVIVDGYGKELQTFLQYCHNDSCID